MAAEASSHATAPKDGENDGPTMEVMARELQSEKEEAERLRKEKNALERELQKASAIIAKSKDQRAVQHLTDENAKLRSELDMLNDQKLQNEALKENIHQLVARSDQQRKLLEDKLTIAENQLANLRQLNGILIGEDVKAPPPYTAVDPLSESTANLEIAKAEAKALGQVVHELRVDKARLQEDLDTVSRELTELKANTTTANKKSGEGPNQAAAGAARSWWNRGTTATNSTSSAGSSSAMSNTAKASSESIPTKSEEHMAQLANNSPSISSQPSQSASTSASTTSKWWGRGAGTPDPIKEIEILRNDRKKLEDELKVALTEAGDLRSQLEEARSAPAVSPANIEGELGRVIDEAQKWKLHAENVLADTAKEREITDNKICMLNQELTAAKVEIAGWKSKLEALSQYSITNEAPQDGQLTVEKYEQAGRVRPESDLESGEREGKVDTGKTESTQVQQLLNNETPGPNTGRSAEVSSNNILIPAEHFAQNASPTLASEVARVIAILQLIAVNSQITFVSDNSNALKQRLAECQKDMEALGQLASSPSDHKLLQQATKRTAELRSTLDSQAEFPSGANESASDLDKDASNLVIQSEAENDGRGQTSLSSTQGRGIAEGLTSKLAAIEAELQLLKEQYPSIVVEFQQQEARAASDQVFNDVHREDHERRLVAEIERFKGDFIAQEEEKRKREIEEIRMEFENSLGGRIAEAEAAYRETLARLKEQEIHQLKADFEKAMLFEVSKAEANARHRYEDSKIRDTAELSRKYESEISAKQAELSAASLRINELEGIVKLNNSEITSLKRVVETKEEEIEALKRSFDHGQQASEAQIQGLYEKVKGLEAELVSARRDRKIEADEQTLRQQADQEEKHKKERATLEEKHRREKTDLEERWKKEQKDKQRILAEYEKHKKDAGELQRRLEREVIAKGEELGGSLRKLKSSEQDVMSLKAELESLRGEHDSAMKGLKRELKQRTDELQTKNHELETIRQGQMEYNKELGPLKEQLTALRSEHNVLSAELEVARASLSRATKGASDKDEAIRLCKTRIDELQMSEQVLKKQVGKLEKEREEALAQLAPLNERIQTLEAAEKLHAENAQQSAATFETRLNEAEAEKVALQATHNSALNKVKQMETEMKTMERKSGQIIRDLQKQLAKERKQKETQDDHMEHFVGSGQDDKGQPQSPSTRTSNLDLSRSTKAEAVGVPRVERLTDDLLHLAQENESLNKRLKNAEQEVRHLGDKVSRITEELEQKSNVIRQYMMRDYAHKLQPDDKPKAQSFNWNILSSSSAMQRMDPLVLAEINTKMQKLLEELTTKMLVMENALNRKNDA